eukprot:TRINITY_DN923_c0_g1_i3.p1 TRINITY_DN923_c0_g1~~TRINITY_DN923_c0_g1_i3.p1  ORF type:complete len:226 (-),score=59.10 TRINITY_DN923_c0_g1_i3:1353-2030(-)
MLQRLILNTKNTSLSTLSFTHFNHNSYNLNFHSFYSKENIKKIRVENKLSAKEVDEILDSIIRVNHAGEYGARRIYKGQMHVFDKTPIGEIIKDMDSQERVHLEKFNEYIHKYRARPSALLPLWNVAGYALGFGTAILGKEAAMACTVAVETEIGKHYDQQLKLLKKHKIGDQELINSIKKFRDDELEHLDTGLEHNAEQAPAYNLLSGFIRNGTKLVIEIAKKI